MEVYSGLKRIVVSHSFAVSFGRLTLEKRGKSCVCARAGRRSTPFLGAEENGLRWADFH
jgi:hypothetical protein